MSKYARGVGESGLTGGMTKADREQGGDREQGDIPDLLDGQGVI